jgi:FkbM family methyltransferase
MPVRRALKTVINGSLSRLGYRVVRDTARSNPLSMAEALRRATARVPDVATVIDVGAATGAWTRLAREYLPRARALLIEANPTHERALQEYTRATPDVDYALAAAGKAPGELYFDDSHAFGGVASSEPREGMTRMQSTSIDHEIASRALPGPYLIKLDTHGFEVPILEGATQALDNTALLVIEAYNFRLERDSLRFYELCAYLAERGFSPADLCDPMHRPRDGMLWQLDLFFLRSDRPEFAHNRYE